MINILNIFVLYLAGNLKSFRNIAIPNETWTFFHFFSIEEVLIYNLSHTNLIILANVQKLLNKEYPFDCIYFFLI